MNISKISYDNTFYTNKLQSNAPAFKALPVKTTEEVLISRMDKKTLQSDFVKLGGKFRYDEAALNGIPYYGAITSNCNGLKIHSRYYRGKKDAIFMQNANKPNESVTSFQKEKIINRNQGSRDVVWKSTDNMFTYVENYDEKGALCQTEIVKHGKNNDGFTIFTTYNEDGTTILEQQIEVGKNLIANTGYSKRVDYFENGIKTKAIEYDSIQNGGKKTAAERKVFLSSLGGVRKTVEKGVRYYTDSKDPSPYAVADETITIHKNGKIKSLDKHFKTLDYTKGNGPIRQLVFNEHANTSRETKDNAMIYSDGATKKPYAIELYEAGNDIPKLICSEEKEMYAKISKGATNLINMSFMDENDRKIGMAAVQKKNGRYFCTWQEAYDERGVRSASKIIKGNQVEIRHYAYDGKTIKTKELFINDRLLATNEYSKGELKKQTITPYDGTKRVIEFDHQTNSARETIYTNPNKRATSAFFYENGVATRKVWLDENNQTLYRDYEEGRYFNELVGEEFIKTLDVLEF